MLSQLILPWPMPWPRWRCTQPGIALFVLVVFIWLAECMGTLSRYVVGYVSQEWFFSTYDSTLGQKLTPSSSIGEAYRT